MPDQWRVLALPHQWEFVALTGSRTSACRAADTLWEESAFEGVGTGPIWWHDNAGPTTHQLNGLSCTLARRQAAGGEAVHFLYFPIVSHEAADAFELLFVLRPFYSGARRTLCRFRWPEGVVEELEQHEDLGLAPVE